MQPLKDDIGDKSGKLMLLQLLLLLILTLRLVAGERGPAVRFAGRPHFDPL